MFSNQLSEAPYTSPVEDIVRLMHSLINAEQTGKKLKEVVKHARKLLMALNLSQVGFNNFKNSKKVPHQWFQFTNPPKYSALDIREIAYLNNTRGSNV